VTIQQRWRDTVTALLRSSLLRTSGVYVATNLVNRAIPFFLIPILTRLLSPAEFGRATMFAVTTNLLVPLVGLNTDAAVSRQYFALDQTALHRYIANCLYVLGVTFALTLAVVHLASRPLSGVLDLPAGWILLAVVVAAGRYLGSLVLVLWQVRGRPLAYAAFFLAQTTVVMAASVWLVVGGAGWQGRSWGDVIGYGGLGLLALASLHRAGRVVHGVDRSALKHALAFGGGLVPHLYGGLLIAVTDRLFLTNMVGLAQTGLYAVAAQLAMIIVVLESSFNLAWIPWLYARLARMDPAELAQVRRLRRYYCALMLGLASALSVSAPVVLGFFAGEDYASATPLVAWLSFGAAFGGMYKMVVNPIFYAGRTPWLAAVTLTTGLLNAGFNYVLVPLHGATGAAQANALSSLLGFLLTAWLSRRVMRELQTRRAATGQPGPAHPAAPRPEGAQV
jgi:O-antigen/teichoic acid export membrane protein